MSAEIVIYGFETSNNMKVRVALGFKEIPYEFRPINPQDRAEVERLSGQYLTPVMLHGDQVLFDSAAIMRYLEAKYRDRPPLFGNSHREQWAIEDMELFGRWTLSGPLMEVVHHRIYGGTVDVAMQQRCNDAFGKAVSELNEKLTDSPWLVGDSLTAADVTCAAVIYRIQEGKVFDLPAGAESISGWVKRVMAYDRYLADAD